MSAIQLLDRIGILRASAPRSSLQAEPVRTPIARTSPSFHGLWRQWRELADSANPFLTPWFFALHARLMAGWEPILFGARRGDSLIAALPLAHKGRTLIALSGEQAPRFDLVGDPAALDAVWSAIREQAGWDLLVLPAVPQDSPLAMLLPDLARRSGYHVAVHPASRPPYFALDGFEEQLSAKFRSTLRRNARKLGNVEFERIATFDRQALAEAFALEGAAWKGEAGSAIDSDPLTRQFFLGLARVFAARGRFSLVFLRAQGRRIAMQFALEDARSYYLYKPGYDPQFAASGPGHLLVREAARDAAQRGLQVFDFLGVDTEWKLQWTSTVCQQVTVRIFRPSLRGHLEYGVQEVLRPRARTLLRQARAAWHARRGGRG